jgi:carboxymethylenebutenolidase
MGDWEDFPAGKRTAEGYLALPTEGDGPGVLLAHAWWGLNSFFTSLADRLAAEGFRVLAPDLFRGQCADSIAEAKELRASLESDYAQSVLMGATDFLKGTSKAKLGLIGFSLGAYHGLWLADQRPADFGAVIVFYGARKARFANSEASFQAHFAETDPYVSSSARKGLEASLKAANRPTELHIYPGTSHWFFEEDRKGAYDAEAAKLAWERTVRFLNDKLG